MKTLAIAIFATTLGLLGSGRAVAQDQQPTSPLKAQYAMSESFVPALRSNIPATVELRSEATVVGREVLLKSVARWSDADAAVFAPVRDLTIATIDPANPFRAVTVDQIRAALSAAGVNLATVRFAGPLACTITRSDAAAPAASAKSLEQWTAAKTAASQPAGSASADAANTQQSNEPVRPLRDVLLADLADRLQLPADRLQLQFNPDVEKTINFAEPNFHFQVTPQRARNLGNVRWDVVITRDLGGAYRKVSIDAIARAWQDEVITTRPLGYRQLITDADVSDQRVLLDRLPNEPLLTREQIVGQQTARALAPGSPFTAHTVEAVPMVKSGQLVTVTLARAGLQLTTVARALEPGTMGQCIKLKNESTRDNFEATVTGPQLARME